MTRTPLLLAIVLFAASTSPLFAQKGGYGGPIGPGSRDGLQPSVNDNRPDAFAYERERPYVQPRQKKLRRR